MEEKQIVEGPYFNVNRRVDSLEWRRSGIAQSACHCILRDEVELAREYALQVQQITEEIARILAWSTAADDPADRDNAPRWIGFSA